jgi:hypothetical protein
MELRVDDQERLEEYLQDALGGMNRWDAKLVSAKLDKLEHILGSEAVDELRSAIKGVLIVETAPSVPGKPTNQL